MISKQTFLLSFGSGILLSLPWLFPSLGWTLFFAFIPLLLAEEQIVKQKNEKNNHVLFLLALPAFLIWNLLSVWWISWVSFVGMLLIVSLNAFLMTSVWWLRHWIRLQFGGAAAFFALPVFWLTLEYFQHNWTIQIPWLTLGNGLANVVKIIQWYEFTGVLGGSLWILLSNILIFLLVKRIIENGFLKSEWSAVYAVLTILIPLWGSVFLYSNYEEKGIHYEVLILQPNIDPYTDKFSGMSPEDQIQRLVSMAESNLSDSTDLILAPETALPEMWEDSIPIQNQTLNSFSGIFRRYPGIRFIGGAITSRKFRHDEILSATTRESVDGSYYYDVFNSALLMDQSAPVQISHKNKLVSGVEKMPFQKYFSFADKYILRLGGTGGSLGAANEPTLLYGKDSVKIGAVICFESAFGEYVGKMVKKGATLLVVMTNDGWWKESAGSWQHFGYSRLRAVETRRSIARSANTGISGFISQRGDVITKTRINSCETISSSIRLNEEITFYARFGDWPGRLSVLLTGMILMYVLWNRLKNSVK